MLCCIKNFACFLWNALGYIVYPLGWITLIVAALKVTLGPSRFGGIRNAIFAKVMDSCCIETKLRRDLIKMKEKLFENMKDIKSADPALQKKGALNILEIGVGTGTNLDFYPAGSRLTCVDPNSSFESYFRQECSHHATHLDPDIKFVVERGEDMASVKSESVDVVVITLVMCSVTHMDSLVREVLRVLVPGGRFYYLEHTVDTPGSWRRRFQNLLSNSDLWPALVDGCMLNRDPEPIIKGAFSKVDHQSIFMTDGKTWPNGTQPTSPHVLVSPFLVGFATK